jgi:hypothetical protein
LEQAGEDAQEGGLAGAVEAEQQGAAGGFELQVDVAQDGGVAVDVGDVG